MESGDRFSHPFRPTGSSIRGLLLDCSHLSFPCVCGIMSNGTFMLFSSPDYFGLPSSSHLPFYPSDIFFQMLCRQLWQSRMQSPGDRKWAGGWLAGRASGFSESHKSWASRTSYDPEAGAVFPDSLPVPLILNQSFLKCSLRRCCHRLPGNTKTKQNKKNELNETLMTSFSSK